MTSREGARWTKKHGKSFYGYKNHVNADAKHKLIRQYVTEARGHDSQKSDGLLNHANTSADVYADSAYRSAETDGKLNHTCAACAAAFISARAAIIRHPRRGRTRTAGRAKFGTHRARVRYSTDLAGGPDRTDDRNRAGESQDRLAEPRLRHQPACGAGADGCRIREKCAQCAPKGVAGAQNEAYPL